MAARTHNQPQREKRSDDLPYRRVAQAITQQILSGQLPAGTRLDVERKLAGQYKLSRNTVRNALTVLEAQGLVRRVPRHGVFVTGGAVQSRWTSTASAILFAYVGGGRTPITRLDPEGYYGGIYRGAAEMAGTLGVPLRTQLITGHVRVPLQEYRPPRPDEVGGVIVLGTFDERYIQMYGSEGVPVVAVDYWTHSPQADSVVVDMESDAVMALDHLAQRGHTTAGFCAVGRKEHGGEDVYDYDPDVWRMLDCLRRAAPGHGIQMRDEWVLLDRWSHTALVEPLHNLLHSGDRPTAMICFTAAAAMPLLQVIGEARLRCPEDMSVITRGGTIVAGRQMTSLEAEPRNMGCIAVKLLLERMQGRRQQAVRVAMVCRLVLGTSTTSARGTPAAPTQ